MTIRWNALWPALKQAVKDFMEDNALRLSAALAFYTMLAIAPLLIIILKIVGAIFGQKAAAGQLRAYTGETLGEGSSAVIETFIQKAGEEGSGLLATAISSVILLFSASGLFGELQSSLNTIWEVKPKPDRGIMGTIKDRFFSMTLVLGTAFLLMASLVLSTVLSSVTKAMGGSGGVVATVLHFLVAFAVTAALFALIFKYLPDVKNKWEHVIVGAVFTAVLFTIGKYLLGWYLGRESTTSVWGAFGSLVAMLLWVYYSGLILFFGAEFTQAYATVVGDAIRPTENAVALTEEDRSQQGIPSREHVAAAAAGGSRGGGGRRPAPAYTGMPERVTFMPGGVAVTCPKVPADGKGRLFKDVLVGAGGVALGVLATSLGKDRMSRAAAREAGLPERIDLIEGRLGHISRIRHDMEKFRLQERVEAVRQRVRSAATTIQAERAGRPKWVVRLGDAIAGRS
jgi:membrane protein